MTTHHLFKSAVHAIRFISRLQKASQQIPERILEGVIPLEENGYNGRVTAPIITIYPGRNRIILSAPHAVNQMREGRLKKSEPYTGAIVKHLNESIGCHGIVKTKFDGTDPNWINGEHYRNTLAHVIQKNNIQYLIDLHCMHSGRKQEIILCTDHLSNLQGNRAFLDSFLEIMGYRGFKEIEIDTEFEAKKEYTIAKYIASKAKIPALQVEVNMRILDPNYQQGIPFKNFLKGLRDYIAMMDKTFAGRGLERPTFFAPEGTYPASFVPKPSGYRAL